MSIADSAVNKNASLDAESLRADFPALRQRIRGKPLVYLDSGATTQKPQTVINAVNRYYQSDHANVHRGAHALSERATAAFEAARDKVRGFINAGDRREIVFAKGATEAINLVAQSFGRQMKAGDDIVITTMEHHANIVPWQLLAQQTGVTLKVAPINDSGELTMEAFERLLGPRTRLVAVTHVSNALGTVNPLGKIIEVAHAHDARVLVDGAQAVSHMPVDVQHLGCDFYAFSGHKLYGPTGVGVLYGKAELLEAMPPYQGGGEMIRSVDFAGTTFADIPYKFEAGTPHIVGVIGLGAAIDYLSGIGMETVAKHEVELLRYATEALMKMEGLRIIGTADEKLGLVSFVMSDIHAHDIGTIVDHEGVAIRVGHHCAMPVMKRFGLAATARASFGVYNTTADIDALVRALEKVAEVFRA